MSAHSPDNSVPQLAEANLKYQSALPIPKGQLAMLLFISTEVMFFTALIATYVVLRFSRGEFWPAQSTMQVHFWIGALNSVVLLASCLTLYLASRAASRNLAGAAKLWLLATIFLGAAFLVVKGYEYKVKFKYGLYPSVSGSLIYNHPDQPYLSRAVTEMRSEIKRSEGLGDEAERLDRLYQVQSGLIDWTQFKVGRDNQQLSKQTAIEAMAYQIFPIAKDARLEKYIRDESSEVRIEHRSLNQKLIDTESELSTVQKEIKRLLPLRDSGDSDVNVQFALVSERAERLTDSISTIRKDLAPLEARLAVEKQIEGGAGLNHEFGLKLPVVIPSGKSWVNTYYLLTGFHAVHLFVGLVVLVGFLFLRLGHGRAYLIDNFSIYWHFVDLVWLVIFLVIYLG